MKVVLTNITKRLGIKDCWKTFRYSSIAMGNPQSQWEKMEKSRKIIYVIINARICHYHLRLLEDTESPAVQAQQRLRERSLGKMMVSRKLVSPHLWGYNFWAMNNPHVWTGSGYGRDMLWNIHGSLSLAIAGGTPYTRGFARMSLLRRDMYSPLKVGPIFNRLRAHHLQFWPLHGAGARKNLVPLSLLCTKAHGKYCLLLLAWQKLPEDLIAEWQELRCGVFLGFFLASVIIVSLENLISEACQAKTTSSWTVHTYIHNIT